MVEGMTGRGIDGWARRRREVGGGRQAGATAVQQWVIDETSPLPAPINKSFILLLHGINNLGGPRWQWRMLHNYPVNCGKYRAANNKPDETRLNTTRWFSGEVLKFPRLLSCHKFTAASDPNVFLGIINGRVMSWGVAAAQTHLRKIFILCIVYLKPRRRPHPASTTCSLVEAHLKRKQWKLTSV